MSIDRQPFIIIKFKYPQYLCCREIDYYLEGQKNESCAPAG